MRHAGVYVFQGRHQLEIYLMRYALIVLGSLVAATVGHVGAGNAASPEPWCQSGGVNNGTGLDCSYRSFQQCYASASGNNAACVPNPFLHEQ
jgi:hypothetical protein